jgi:hypothetical protein
MDKVLVAPTFTRVGFPTCPITIMSEPYKKPRYQLGAQVWQCCRWSVDKHRLRRHSAVFNVLQYIAKGA